MYHVLVYRKEFIMADLATSAVCGSTQVKKLEAPEIRGNRIFFKNKEGNSFIFSQRNNSLVSILKVSEEIRWAKNLMTIFNKFYDENTGCVSAKKISDIGTEIDKRYLPYLTEVPRARMCHNLVDWNRFLRNALSDYTNPNSDGGADITEKEIYDYYERSASVIQNDKSVFLLSRNKESINEKDAGLK